LTKKPEISSPDPCFGTPVLGGCQIGLKSVENPVFRAFVTLFASLYRGGRVG